jgi:ribosomal-protein-alanine N-acetyltransferase
MEPMIVKENDILTERLILKPFETQDITQDYVNWLNDPNVNQFLEISKTQSLESVIAWVNWTNNDPTRKLFGIFMNQLHIGNLTLYDIEHTHRSLRIGITIGRKELWGKGLGVEALENACSFIFNSMNFHRIEAGIYEPNVNSIKLFTKAGFALESVMKERIYFQNNFINMLLFVRIKSN